MNIASKIENISFKQRIISCVVGVFLILSLSLILLRVTFSAPETFNGIKLSDVEIDNLKISSINITEENGIIKYNAEVSAKEDTNVSYASIIFKDDNGEELVKLVGYIGSSLNKGDKKEITASTDANLSNTKSIDYEVIHN